MPVFYTHLTRGFEPLFRLSLSESRKTLYRRKVTSTARVVHYYCCCYLAKKSERAYISLLFAGRILKSEISNVAESHSCTTKNTSGTLFSVVAVSIAMPRCGPRADGPFLFHFSWMGEPTWAIATPFANINNTWGNYFSSL